jgi:hypothetical protein
VIHNPGGHPATIVSRAQLKEKPCAEIVPETAKTQLTAVKIRSNVSLINKVVQLFQ